MPTPEMEEIISQLKRCEREVLIAIGGLKGSPNKNIRAETILKKLPAKDIRCGKKSLKSLTSSGLIWKYRQNNYAVSALGMKIAIFLKKEDIKKKNRDLSRIFMITNYS
jgi:hypothetical protein